MFKNYFKVALRNIWKRKAISLISLFGLAVGISSCLLIYQFIYYENSYDDFHNNIERIYFMDGEVDLGFATIQDRPGPSIASRVKNEFPEVEQVVRASKEELVVRKDQITYKLSGIAADPSFLKIFSFNLNLGNFATALKNKHGIIGELSFTIWLLIKGSKIDADYK